MLDADARWFARDPVVRAEVSNERRTLTLHTSSGEWGEYPVGSWGPDMERTLWAMAQRRGDLAGTGEMYRAVPERPVEACSAHWGSCPSALE